MSTEEQIIFTARSLDLAGLCWKPEIGDEVVLRSDYESISILFDPKGLSPSELRQLYLWLPSVEQLVEQFEARAALIEHVGMTEVFAFEAVIKAPTGLITVEAQSLRLAFAKALNHLLQGVRSSSLQ